MKIDLHIHSNYSDGDDNVSKIVSDIKKSNISLFSITDHDNMNSIRELIKFNDISYIPGVEVSSLCDNAKVHILGYGISLNGNTQDICDSICKKRKIITLKIINDLLKHGYCFKSEDLERFYSGDYSLSKMDIAKIFYKYGYADSVTSAFKNILKNYELGPFIRVDYKKVIEAIKSDGGISVLAHAFDIGKKQKLDTLTYIDKLCDSGISGLEIASSSHDEKEKNIIKELCYKRNLICTDGSDYHGVITKSNISLGINMDNLDERIKRKIIKR